MARAAELGRAVRRAVSPNPGVGCIIVTTDGRTFAGATEPPGGRHAEVVALDAARNASANLQGATAWVTLEPCSHVGRTGPCASALVTAGVRRVVAALGDPDPNVSGDGFATLLEAGVEIRTGVRADEVAHDLRAYLTHRRLGRPFVTLKLAMAIDGRTTSSDPATQWITGAGARADGHRLRGEHDAILVGANTVRVDNPRLTTRDAPGPDPLRVVLGTAAEGAAVHPCVERHGALDQVLRGLAADGVTSLLVEGGAYTAREFHDARFVDEYVLFVANVEPGDAGSAMAAMWDADVIDVTKIDNDVRVTLVPRTRS
jgi:diaminohydroxyphosphoribosylaminopyrimidine deaminase/5-amino-6-(5-phosphoribosylamino)uracil reductase